MNKLSAILIAAVFAVTTTAGFAMHHEATASAATMKTVKVEKHTKKRVKKAETKASEVAQKAQCKKAHKHKHEEAKASEMASAE